jgi:hypothetical protein
VVLLNQTQEEFGFIYDQPLFTSVNVYVFGGNGSTGAGWWNTDLINLAVMISYRWQYVGQEFANIYAPPLFGAGLSSLLSISGLILLRKKEA